MLPYTDYRLHRILDKFYDCHLEKIQQGYKANRRKGYRELYKIIQNSDGKVISEKVSLNGLRLVFTEAGYPVDDKDDPNVDAILFLEIVHSIENAKQKREDGYER